MPTNYTTAATIVNTDAVRQRVMIAIVTFALGVMNTEASSNPLSIHQARVALAVNVLNDPTQYSYRFAIAIISQNEAAASDADIDAALTAIWSAMAGIPASA